MPHPNFDSIMVHKPDKELFQLLCEYDGPPYHKHAPQFHRLITAEIERRGLKVVGEDEKPQPPAG